MKDKNEYNDVIDLRDLLIKIIKSKKVFFITLPIVFTVSCLLIICVPRTYSTETKMAPELDSPIQSGGLSDIASSFGIDLSTVQSNDAISPLLYPDLMDDNGFVASLFNIKVKSGDGAINCTYYEYLRKHQDKAFWEEAIQAVKRSITKLISRKKKSGDGKFNPYMLSKEDDAIMEIIRSNISISVDKKNAVITISADAQNPVICKILADSTRSRLQAYITNYRTNKARNDMKYYQKLVKEAHRDYVKARQAYASTSDANMDVIMESVRANQEDMENEMQLKYNNYTALNTQLQAAIAKVQERTPAFTMIKGAAVPIKASKPKRMIFVLAMLFLAFIVDCCFILRHDVKDLFFPRK